MVTVGEVLMFLIEKGPGRTELELAQAVYGPDGYQQQVNQDCTVLLNRGKVRREGHGGPLDSYKYYPNDVRSNVTR